MKKSAHKNGQQPKNLTTTETSVGSSVLQNGWLGNVAASFSLWKVASDSNGEPLQWGQYRTQNPVWSKIIIQNTFGGTLARNRWCFNCYILISFLPNKTCLVMIPISLSQPLFKTIHKNLHLLMSCKHLQFFLFTSVTLRFVHFWWKASPSAMTGVIQSQWR